MSKDNWSPFCAEYIAAGLLTAEGEGTESPEVRLMLKTKDGGQFMLKCSTAAASNLWEGLCLLLNDDDFPAQHG